MTTSERPPGFFSAAERTTRRTTLIVGAGFGAFILGSITTSGVLMRIGGALMELQSDRLVWLITGVLPALWVLLYLPAFGWLAGRFLDTRPLPFALPAALTGLGVDVLLTLATAGLEGLFTDWQDLLLRLVLFVFGVLLSMQAVKQGSLLHEKEAAKSKATAESNRAEYRAFSEREKKEL